MKHLFGDPIGELNTIIDDMKNIVYVEGIGRCYEVTVNRVNDDGVTESYNTYEPIKKN